MKRLSNQVGPTHISEHFRGVDGSQFDAARIRKTLKRAGLKPLPIAPGYSRGKGQAEYLNVRLPKELRAIDVFDTLLPSPA